MAKFCSNCGKPIQGTEKFCAECGSPIKQSAPSKRICPHCGKEMKLTSKFCPHCGKNPAEPKAAPQTAATVNPYSQTAARPVSAVNRAAQTVQAAEANLPGLTNSIQASAGTGAISLEIPDISGTVGGAVSGAAQILSPIKTLFSGIGGFFRSIKNAGKDKRALVGAILMAVLWTVFWLWNRSGKANGVSEFLSALTFAEGGTRGTFGQVVGGIFGKGLVMSGFASLFSGGFGEMFGGIKRLFGKGMYIGWAVFGLGAAALCYQLFAGYAGTYGIAVAVSGAVLSLQALGGRFGFIRSFAASLTSKKSGGARLQNDVRLKSLLGGAAVGFTLSAALSAYYIPWWIPVIVTAFGLILVLIFKGKAVQA